MKKTFTILFSIFGIVFLASCESNGNGKHEYVNIVMKDKFGIDHELSTKNGSKSIYQFIYDNYNHFDIDHSSFSGTIKYPNNVLQASCLKQSSYIEAEGNVDGKAIDYKHFDNGIDVERYDCYFKENLPTYGGMLVDGKEYSLEAGALPPVSCDDSYMTQINRLINFDNIYHITRMPNISDENLKYHFELSDGAHDFDFTSKVKVVAFMSKNGNQIVIDLMCPLMLYTPVNSNNLYMQYAYCVELMNTKSYAQSSFYIDCQTGETEIVLFSYKGKDTVMLPNTDCEFSLKYISKMIDVSQDIETFKNLMNDSVVQ